MEIAVKDIVLRSKDPEDRSVVEKTIIDGNQLRPVVTFRGVVNASCVVEGFTIQHGKAGNGGGISGSGYYPCIRNNLIVNNTANDEGGGLHQCNGLISNNTIYGNVADEGGGGLSECGGTIRDNLITQNSSFEGGGGLSECYGTIEGNTISLNTAPGGGGLAECNGLIRDNVITENEAGDGGGLWRCDGVVWGNTITSNSATAAGGGLSRCGGTVAGNIIARNTAANGAGLAWCDLKVMSNLIVVNSAELDGGGVYEGITPEILNNTIVGNSAGRMGGGLQYELFSVTVRNCIISGNSAPSRPEAYLTSNPSHCCIPGWTGGGTDIITLSPQLVNADGPDGDPSTWQDNNYRLKWSSPCVDSGDNSVLDPPGLDVDGNLRIAYGIDSLTVDMGAYEFNSSRLQITHMRLDDGRAELTWVSQPNDVYTLWSREDLLSGEWASEGIIFSHGASTIWLDTRPPVPQKFYRIEMGLP